MIQSYYPVGLMLLLAAGLGIFFLLLFRWLGPYAPNKLKATSYECGIEPQGDVRQPLSVRYYVVAMAFVVFDIEVVFLYPWAVQVAKFGIYGFIEMMAFVVILAVGLVYIWKKGVLSWQ